MKKLYVHAYLVGNLGDDLMVAAVCRRYPKTLFHFVNNDIYQKRFADLPNCKVYAIQDPDFPKLHEKYLKKYHKNVLIDGLQGRLIHTSSAVAHIGGSVFVQHKDDYSEAIGVDRDLLEYGRRLFVVGANFGPYTDEQYLRDYRTLFASYAGICLRDRASYDLFKDLPNVRCAPDPVFTLRPALPAAKKRKAVFAPIELSIRKGKNDLAGYEASYAAFQAALVSELLKRDYEVTLLAFCQAEQDETMLQHILAALPEEEAARVRCKSYTDNRNDILSEFAESELVIGTRFHSIVLGLVYGCRTLPVIYSGKTAQMLSDIGHPAGLPIAALSARGAAAGSDPAAGSNSAAGPDSSELRTPAELIDALAAAPVFDIEPVRKAAEGQFYWLDRFL